MSLHEKTGQLGGNLLLAAIPPGRARMLKIVDFFKDEIRRLGAEVTLNAQVSLDTIRSQHPDVVLLATGAEPLMPDLPGIESPHVRLASDVLKGKVDTGRHVVVLGGGLVGLETADYLREQGKAIIVIEKLPNVGADTRVEGIFQKFLMMRLTRTSEPVLILTGTEVIKIGPNHVTVRTQAGEKTLPGIDSVVVATGFRSVIPIDLDALTQECEVHVIGDAVQPQTLFEAIHSAARIAYTI